MNERLFEGLIVLDCASYIAGPAAATVMSDFGAQVIKIEPPGAGDPYRRRAVPGQGRAWRRNPHWELDARNKKSLALDIASEPGHAVLRRLVARADVFITNYPPRVRRRLRIAYDDLAPLNIRLIYGSFTGYGETGAEADKPGFDATAWWARSGLMHLVRSGSDTAPARSLPGMGDHPSAMAMYGAIVTALYQRERTGKGGRVGSSLLANGLWANGCHVQATLCGETIVPQPPRERGQNALRMHYQCRDGRWLLLSIVSDERRWQLFKDCLDASALDDARFATAELREANSGALIAALDGIFATRTLADWRAKLDQAGLVFGIVAVPQDIPEDPQMRASGAIVPFEDGGLLTVSSPIWIDGQEKVAPRPAPELGEHSDAVLTSAGYTEDQIAELRVAGIVG
ncbi:MAG: CoA transferase [Alphaproteobacteria bacterium]|nr:CoA transferase [Alphaproteobacteria bacterium]